MKLIEDVRNDVDSTVKTVALLGGGCCYSRPFAGAVLVKKVTQLLGVVFAGELWQRVMLVYTAMFWFHL